VHYPLRGGEQYNVVVTFHSRQQEEWGVTEGSPEEVQSYFQGICPKARQLIDLPKSWKRWATADREPIGQWTFGRATLLGDAAHPTTQYMAQGACMALEDAVTLGEALRVNGNDFARRFDALPAFAHRPHRAHRALSGARWAASTTPRASSAWCATTCGKAARPSASTTRWNGCTAGTSATAWPPTEAARNPDRSETRHERTRPPRRPAWTTARR
jgi:2-polyprenyl-6-methoxyphenol hydroxylase-like FAD-dependent oxidoreductase